MKNTHLRNALARPALHTILALCFAVAFLWPIFALTRPTHTFHFLYLAWFLCLGALFAVSRGREPSEADGSGDTDEDTIPPTGTAVGPEAH